MHDIKYTTNKNKGILYYLTMLISMICAGMIIGSMIIKLLLMPPQEPTFNGDGFNLAYRAFLLNAQAIMSISLFILGPTLYLYIFEKKPITYLFKGEQRYIRFSILLLTLMLVAMMVNTLFIHWNMHVELPDFLKNFEKWAQAKEAELKKLTELLTSCSSLKDLILAIFIIAVIPAIGEELVFRGILQSLLFRYTKRIHISIGIAAFIFSAIHLQIYGFLPRFLLGVLFGYFYWWTKNLAFPIIAHFFNNSISLIIVFLHNIGTIKHRQELELNQVLPIPILLIFAMLVVLLLAYLYKITRYLHK